MSAQSDKTKPDKKKPDKKKPDEAKPNETKPGSTRPEGTRVIVCQNKTCKQQGSKQVLAAFRRSVPADVWVEPSGCLGQCGNGPMAIVITEDNQTEPAKTWYSTVQPADAFAIAAHHFKKDDGARSDAALPQSPAQQSSVWIWLVGAVLFLSLCALMALVLGGPAHYG